MLIGMIKNLVWESNLHTATTHIWMWSTQMRYINFGAIVEIGTPEKKS